MAITSTSDDHHRHDFQGFPILPPLLLFSGSNANQEKSCTNCQQFILSMLVVFILMVKMFVYGRDGDEDMA